MLTKCAASVQDVNMYVNMKTSQAVQRPGHESNV